MPDIFISYSTVDQKLANFVHKHLGEESLDVFLAPISIEAGSPWRDEILDNIRDADWLVFLASKEACKSNYVQQELGAALGLEKNIVPILWDMPPEELPGWVDQKQALDLRGASNVEIQAQVKNIAKRVKADIRNGYLVAGLIVAGLIMLGRSK